jgi:hypothetical protein
VALRALAAHDKPLPNVPLAVKTLPMEKTYLMFNKTSADPARIDLYVNNFGDAKIEPKLYDAQKRPVALTIEIDEEHRVSKPHGDPNWQHEYNTFYGTYGTHNFYRLRVDAPPGVYHLDAGDQASTSVLYSDINQFLQVAPQGMVLEAKRSYYFPVPANVQHVEYFSHRPIEIVNPSGQIVSVEPLGNGRFKFATNGQAGAWRINAATDAHVYNTPYTKVDSFVKFINIPTVIALTEPGRLFDVNATAYAAPEVKLPAESKAATFVDGRFGKAALFPRGEAIEVKDLPAAAPRERGTIEFWYSPMWSISEFQMIDKPVSAQLHQQLFNLDPIVVTHIAQPVDSGRSSHYLFSKLDVHLVKAKDGVVSYPVILYPQAGRWYHIAITWSVDGAKSDMEVFVNGRRQSYHDYRGGVPYTLKPDDLSPAGTKLRVGSAVTYGGAAMPGQLFDDVRVSRDIRYTDDFAAPDKPMTADEQTYLLMNLDGSCDATVAGATVPGAFAKFSKLRDK